MLEERVTAFVDWPNVERGLRGHFRGLSQHQNLGRLAISAIEAISERIGSLETAHAYADWRTAYAEIIPLLEANYRFRAVLVPRKASGGDRCDTAIVADIVDFTHTHAATHKPAILLCAGDADYAVAARRALERGFEVYVASVSGSLSPELESLSTAVYPLERYFSDAARRSMIQLIPNIRAEDLPSLAEVRRWAGFVRLLNRMTQSLDYVTLLYFARRLSESRPRYGETIGDAYTSVEEAIALGIVRYGVPVPNPNNPDQYVQTIVLSNGHVLVRCILENINIKAPSESPPDAPIY